MSFVNNTNESHQELILQLFDDADEIVIASGFLKASGLRNIEVALRHFCNKAGKNISFFIGTGYGETDPKTLRKLNSIVLNATNGKLILCTPDAGIFHPKIYLFRKGTNISVITGSSNLTEAGLLINDEVSYLLETDTHSLDYVKLRHYFDELTRKYYESDVKGLISQYELQLENYRRERRPPFHFKRRKTTVDGIDMARLKAYYLAYLRSTGFIDIEFREAQYEQARENITIIASDIRLTNKQFHDIFGPLVGHREYVKLWHSGSIHRTTYKTLNFTSGFRAIARKAEELKSSDASLAFQEIKLFKNQLKKSKQIHGVGENILTEILMSLDPKKFANLNDNPVSVLSFLGGDFPSPEKFTRDHYKEYMALLEMIRVALEMRTYLEIDSFFNYVYWNILE